MYNAIIYTHYIRKISRQNPGVVSKHKPLAALKWSPRQKSIQIIGTSPPENWQFRKALKPNKQNL